MYFIIVKKMGVVVASISLFSTLSFGKSEISQNELINIAGKQRMLSQRIAKDYLYIGRKIATSKAQREFKESMKNFLLAHKKLHNSIDDPEIKNLLDFVALSSDDLKELASKEFSLDNAQLILDLSESMLEGSQYVFDSLQKRLKIKESNIIAIATKQRMLSQRIAKYYISYQSGIKDKNTIDMMQETVKDFSKNLNVLMKNGSNSSKVNKKLAEIDKLWKIVHKFYNNIEKGGLPLIVFNSTDKITKKMDEVTKMYLF